MPGRCRKKRVRGWLLILALASPAAADESIPEGSPARPSCQAALETAYKSFRWPESEAGKSSAHGKKGVLDSADFQLVGGWGRRLEAEIRFRPTRAPEGVSRACGPRCLRRVE